MKVKLLKRDASDYERESKFDIHKISRNYDPSQHPMEHAREYKRALNAVKMDKMFAKPFLGQLNSGHSDFVSSMCLHPSQVSCMASASADGQIKIWNLSTRNAVAHLNEVRANSEKQKYSDNTCRFVRSLTFTPSSSSTPTKLISVGDDKKIRLWEIPKDIWASNIQQMDYSVVDQFDGIVKVYEPHSEILTKSTMTDVSHHHTDPLIATCGLGSTTKIHDLSTMSTVKEFNWGVDSVHSVRFNQIETHVLGACASDRSIILYDIRQRVPMRKVVMEMKTNKICWNPMEAFVFIAANEDYNTYAFDLRNLKRPVNIHMDHIGAVIDVEYAPTGREFVSGSYDKTIRIFKSNMGRSRDVYHTKRMQRLTTVQWSKDNRYILSGSDEMNIRLWKAQASAKLAPLKRREKAAVNYNEKLKAKFAAHPQIRRIAQFHRVPKHILTAKGQNSAQQVSIKRKEANRRAHSKPGSVPFVSKRDKPIIGEHE